MAAKTETSKSANELLEVLRSGNVKKRRSGTQCSVGAFLDGIEDADTRSELATWLDGRMIEASRLATQIKETMGKDLSAPSISRHRRRVDSPATGCTCPL